MASPIDNNKGFTLIEIIATLVIIGIMAAAFSLSFSQGVTGFLFARDNMATAQKAQLIMTRLTKELINVSAIDPASNETSITFTRPSQDGGQENHTVSWEDDSHTLQYDGDDGDTLADNLATTNGLQITYLDANGAVTANLANCRIIQITVRLMGAGNTVSTFSTQVVPRNI